MSVDPSLLEPNSSATLRSAQGYYELGMLAECESALSDISAEELLRPEGLELSIVINMDHRHFEQALEICDIAIEHHSDAPFGFVNKAYALHELGNTEGALRILEEAHMIVAVETVAIYNRGCYLACLNRDSEAYFWVSKAIRLDPALERQALADPDLMAIRDRLASE